MTARNDNGNTGGDGAVSVESTALFGDCCRVTGLPVIHHVLVPEYSCSDSQMYVHGVGTLGRVGLCAKCNAAIYRRESLGKTFPDSVVGPKYHAVERGLVLLPNA